MQRRHIFLWIAATVAAALLVLSTVTIGLPVGARIIDASTRRPVEDVVVVAAWQVEAGTLAGSVPAGALYAAETVSGSDGRFAFSPWLRLHLPFFPLSFLSLHHSQSPELLIYRRGYAPLIIDNAAGRRESHTYRACCTFLLTGSWWDGRDIELQRWDAPDLGTLQAFETGVVNSVVAADGRVTCRLSRIAEMLRRLHADLGDVSFVAGNQHIVRTCGHDEHFTIGAPHR